MTATLSMVPVAQIRPSKANPRAEFDEASAPRHGSVSSSSGSADRRSPPY